MKKLVKKSENKFNRLESFGGCDCDCKCGCSGKKVSSSDGEFSVYEKGIEGTNV